LVRDHPPPSHEGGHTIRQYCDRGAILAGGRLQLFDDLASAFERYRRLLLEPSA
jgi:ABC-type polysaccharide/polyol phosphate transport system ATPase subunit